MFAVNTKLAQHLGLPPARKGIWETPFLLRAQHSLRNDLGQSLDGETEAQRGGNHYKNIASGRMRCGTYFMPPATSPHFTWGKTGSVGGEQENPGSFVLHGGVSLPFSGALAWRRG